jgi:two-component system heavy metal sensor histidine kinase CusS
VKSGDRRSLTLRLTLLFSAASTIVLLLIGYAFQYSLGRHFLHEDALELRGKIELVRNLVGRMQQGDGIGSPATRLDDALAARLDDALIGHDNFALTLATADGRPLYAHAGTAFGPAAAANARADAPRAIDGLAIDSVTVSGHHYSITRFTVPEGAAEGGAIRATLAMNVDHHRMFMTRVRDSTLALVVAGALAAALLGWLMSRIGLAPVRAFSTLTSRITADRLDTRIAVQDLPRELVPLGDSFNAMLARLEDSFRRLEEFSSDLAHELRTPISALMTQSQVALSRSRTTDEYREVLYSAVEEYERLARMITDMLFLAKADDGLLVPAREAVDLRVEIAALYDFYDALVESKAIDLKVSGEGIIDGDQIMIRRALSNLLSNAIRHAPSGSAIGAAIRREGAEIVLTLTNGGEPIPRDLLGRVFDRFYRIDPSRERSSAEGAGLGLAITKTIVTALGGDIRVSSDHDGTRFEVRLAAARDGAKLAET